MVYIPAGNYKRGSIDAEARADESPIHQVEVAAFWMDQTEVTNAQFRAFVESTGYITTAEKKTRMGRVKKRASSRYTKTE